MSLITSYKFSEEQNQHFLRQALKFISSHKMSPTPLNYTIGYEYVSGGNSGLTQAADLLIKEKKTIDNDSAIELYKQYISDPSVESLEKINHDLQTLIGQTRDSLETSSQKASAAGTNFEEQASSIASANSIDDLKHVISDIVSETKGLADVSNSLQSELTNAQHEMEQLRIELARTKVVASTDALTGLLNRGAFDTALTDILDHPEEQEACLTMLDLDHFKQFNDNHGHLIGDNVLKFTAGILQKHADSHHFVARYGGEEMAIIMPDTSLEKASEIAENIRSTLESSKLKKKNNSELIGKVTVSIGISTLKPNDTVEDFIMRADNALYKAKETGRNRVLTEE
ncbi:MAG: GGDEF domain-containing protein [Methylococcaceae bacterium]